MSCTHSRGPQCLDAPDAGAETFRRESAGHPASCASHRGHRHRRSPAGRPFNTAALIHQRPVHYRAVSHPDSVGTALELARGTRGRWHRSGQSVRLRRRPRDLDGDVCAIRRQASTGSRPHGHVVRARGCLAAVLETVVLHLHRIFSPGPHHLVDDHVAPHRTDR